MNEALAQSLTPAVTGGFSGWWIFALAAVALAVGAYALWWRPKHKEAAAEVENEVVAELKVLRQAIGKSLTELHRKIDEQTKPAEPTAVAAPEPVPRTVMLKVELIAGADGKLAAKSVGAQEADASDAAVLEWINRAIPVN